MDSLGDLFPLLVGAGYLALRFMSAKRKAAARNAPPAVPVKKRRKASAPSAFEQLVSRLEEQATEARTAAQQAEAQQAAAPPARRTRVAGRAEAPRRIAPPAIASAPRSPFDEASDFASETAGYDHRATDYEHERHGFGDENPLSEETFERMPASRLASSRNALPAFDPHGLMTADEPARPESLVPALGTPEALREAFVLQTILTRRPAPRRASGPPTS